MRGEPSIEVRPAQSADLEAIARFNEAMALETEGIRLEPATIRAGVRAVLDDPSRGRYLVAEVQGAPRGALLVTFEWSDWRNALFLWIQSVYVEPPFRRRGLFTALYRAVEAWAREPGHCGIRLYVEHENAAARSVYERLGLRHGRYVVLETPDRLGPGGTTAVSSGS